MYREIKSPEQFVAAFNTKFPDAYRKITAQDVNNWIKCRLIGRYGYFVQNKELSEKFGFYQQDDFETVRGLLQYEQILEKNQKQQVSQPIMKVTKCQICKRLLTSEPDKTGRPRIYCPDCVRPRNRRRQFKHRHPEQN